MAQNHRVNYYTNPAFCQQSEFYATTTAPIKLQRCSSMREAPIGANSTSPQKFERHSSLRYYHQTKHCYNDDPKEMDEKEIQINQQVINELKMEEMNISKNRYAYLAQRTVSPQPETQIKYIREHRYATIPTDDEFEEEDKDVENIREMSPNRVHYTNMNYRYGNSYAAPDHNGNTPPKERIKSAPIPAPRTLVPIKTNSTPTTPKKYDPIATQKLHELLSTPRKTPSSVHRTNSVIVTPNKTPKRDTKSPAQQYTPTYSCVSPIRQITSTPNQSPYFSPQNRQMFISPKAQQKLQYFTSSPNLGPSYNITLNPIDSHLNRNTAVIQPIRSNQSVYSETTISGKSAGSSNSWMNLSQKFNKDNNSNATLAVAALMMILCGALTSGFCFYMISLIGRKYYLDFALISGFTCFVLGLLGFRTRTCRWLPNRNYISGYIVLSMFSLLTCAGLLVLLGLRPKPGSPLADVTSGAVCGISALTLLFASLGVLTSYCCKYPPPDNRVEHCAPGFTV